jgi:pseudouridine synthase
MQIRLNKYLANAGVCSRRKAEEHILAGDVIVNDAVIDKLGTTIDDSCDIVIFKGEKVKPTSELQYFAIYKPKGHLSTVSDEFERPTVMDIIPKDAAVYPVGRLDADSEGLMLLTNDGELTQLITHPSFKHEKEYDVDVVNSGRVVKKVDDAIKRLTRGLEIDGHLMKADEVNIIPSPESPNRIWHINLVLHTGYNRQIRKMSDKIGLEVLKLVRIRIGKLSLDELKLAPGEYKQITKDQIV